MPGESDYVKRSVFSPWESNKNNKYISCVHIENVFFTRGTIENKIYHFVKKHNKKPGSIKLRYYLVYDFFTLLVSMFFLAISAGVILMIYFKVALPIIKWNYQKLQVHKQIEFQEERQREKDLLSNKKKQEQLEDNINKLQKELESVLRQAEENKNKIENNEKAIQELPNFKKGGL